MRSSTPLLIVVGLSALLVSACRRDGESNNAPDAQSADFGEAPAVSAPAVAEPSPRARTVPTPNSAPVKRDSGLSFTDLDKNMDSDVTRDELPMTEMLHQHFNEADTSGDGKLSYAEIERHRMDMTLEPQAFITDGRSIVQMDTNGDGGVSRDELSNNEMLFRHFDEADRDRDGRLSAGEIDSHRSAMASGN